MTFEFEHIEPNKWIIAINKRYYTFTVPKDMNEEDVKQLLKEELFLQANVVLKK